MFGIEKNLYQELSQPSPGSSSIVDGARLRKLYLQAASQQWFAPEKVDFTLSTQMDPKLAETWSGLVTIFYTLEKMGLGVLDNMMGRAVARLRSDDAALYLSTQCSDEARHVFLLEIYLRKLGKPPRYDKKFLVLGKVASLGAYRVENWLFSTLFSESFASAFLRRVKGADIDALGHQMCSKILSDEHRHLHFLHVVLPDVMESLSLIGKQYVRASQYFIMKFAERVTASLAVDSAHLGMSRNDLLEEVFENVRKSYETIGLGRDFLRFPSIRG